ncbi:MAG TPA: type II toxin-antitoxin system RelE/ParE family toxin [Acidimicrobiales bacterium]|nr:type II toxin-antitoxin system RelE/ParE family toxin [Acidimicrobiales bacterium]
MATLVFSPEADDELTRLESDPRRHRLAARLNTALDALEANPGDAHNRRRRFDTIGLWGIAVVAGDEEWLILWEPGDGDDVVVHHIIPAP